MWTPRNSATGSQDTSHVTANAEPIEGERLPVRVNWDRMPVSVHSDEREILESLILYLRKQHNLRKRSIVMDDREDGGFLFFIYQICDPRWIAEFLNQLDGGESNG